MRKDDQIKQFTLDKQDQHAVRKVYQALQPQLEPGDAFLYFVTGNSSFLRSSVDVIVITLRRLFLCEKVNPKISRVNFESFPLQEIKSIEITKGTFASSITINPKKLDYEFVIPKLPKYQSTKLREFFLSWKEGALSHPNEAEVKQQPTHRPAANIKDVPQVIKKVDKPQQEEPRQEEQPQPASSKSINELYAKRWNKQHQAKASSTVEPIEKDKNSVKKETEQSLSKAVKLHSQQQEIKKPVTQQVENKKPPAPQQEIKKPVTKQVESKQKTAQHQEIKRPDTKQAEDKPLVPAIKKAESTLTEVKKSQIAKLDQLLNKQLITKSEYESKKAEIMAQS